MSTSSTTDQPETLKECCLTAYLHQGTPKGSFINIDGLECYETKSTSKAKTILLFPDAFGHRFPNLQLIADKYAEKGYYVLVLDLLGKGTVPWESVMNLMPGEQASNASYYNKITSVPGTLFSFAKMMVTVKEADVHPKILKVLTHLEKDPDVKAIGLQGYCFGGKYSLHHNQKKYKVVCAVASHPSFVAIPKDIDVIQNPLLICRAETDIAYTNNMSKKTDAIMAKKGTVYETEIYKGTVHGFAAKCDETNKKQLEQKEKAFTDSLNFYNQYLK